MHVELTNGNSAELLDDLSGITNDERDSIELAYAEAAWVFDEESGQMVDRASEVRKLKALNRRIIELAVVSWTLAQPLPKDDPTVLGRIVAGDGKALEKAAWALKYTAAPVDTSLEGVGKAEDGSPDRDAPFLSPNGSAALSSTTA